MDWKKLDEKLAPLANWVSKRAPYVVGVILVIAVAIIVKCSV